eukprot:3143137-Rhodomonas_salina.2
MSALDAPAAVCVCFVPRGEEGPVGTCVPLNTVSWLFQRPSSVSPCTRMTLCVRVRVQGPLGPQGDEGKPGTTGPVGPIGAESLQVRCDRAGGWLTMDGDLCLETYTKPEVSSPSSLPSCSQPRRPCPPFSFLFSTRPLLLASTLLPCPPPEQLLLSSLSEARCTSKWKMGRRVRCVRGGKGEAKAEERRVVQRGGWG